VALRKKKEENDMKLKMGLILAVCVSAFGAVGCGSSACDDYCDKVAECTGVDASACKDAADNAGTDDDACQTALDQLNSSDCGKK
jgi:hypothetical protein